MAWRGKYPQRPQSSVTVFIMLVFIWLNLSKAMVFSFIILILKPATTLGRSFAALEDLNMLMITQPAIWAYFSATAFAPECFTGFGK